ncbi:MAG: TetR/AcrR family transcriptional regulator, partial [Pseudomonas sp.]
AGEQVDVICAELFAQDRPLEAFIDAYLSEWHQTSPDEGCPLPTMSSELGLRGQQSPTTDVVLNARLEQVQGTLEDEDAADQSVVIMSTLVGALLLSRSVENSELAQRILDVTRAYLKQPRD